MSDFNPYAANKPILNPETAEQRRLREAAEAQQRQGNIDRRNDVLQFAEHVSQGRQANLERYQNMVPVTNEEYSLMNEAIKVSEKPQEEAYRWAAAVAYSREFNMPLAHTIANLDIYNRFWQGHDFQPTVTNWDSIANSFRVGRMTGDQAGLIRQWMDSGGSNPELETQIEEITRQIEGLGDNIPRPWYVEALKAGAQALPFMARTAGAGIVAGGLMTGATIMAAGAAGLTIGTGGLGTVLAPAVIAAYAGLASRAASFIQSASEMEALEYYKQRVAGIPHETARTFASISGLAQAAVEQALGQTAEVIGRAIPGVQQIAGSMTGNIVRRLVASGRLGGIAQGLIQYTGNAFEEAVEEAVQSLISDGVTATAAAMADIDADLPPTKEIINSAWQSAVAGFRAALVLGIPVTGASMIDSAQQLGAMRRGAEQMNSREVYIKEFMPGMPETMTEEQKRLTLGEIYDGTKNRQPQAAPEVAEGIDTEGMDLDDESPTGPETVTAARRLPDGTLFSQQDERTSRTTRGQEATQLYGDPLTGQRYGQIRYTTDDDGAITVEKVLVRDGYQELRREIIQDFLAKNPGVPIAWEPQAAELQELKADLIKENPRGEQAGLSYYDSDRPMAEQTESGKLFRKMKDVMPNLSTAERVAGIELVKLAAEREGLSTDAWIKKNFAPDMLRPASQYDQAGQDAVFQGAKSRIKGMAQFERDAKAIIYASERADFSTWTHELAHVFRRNMADDLRSKAEKAFGVQGGKWTVAQEEDFAVGFEEYLRTGKAKDTETRTLFQKMAAWLQRIYRNLASRVNISDDIREVYDSILGLDGTGVQKAERLAATVNTPIQSAIITEEGLPVKPLDKIPATKPTQPAQTLADVYALVEASQQEFTEWTEAQAAKYGTDIRSRPALKDQGRAARKITAEYGPETILDINGKTLVFDDLPTLYRAAQEMAELEEVVRIKDRFSSPMDGSYRDILLNVRMKNGAIVELQLNTQQMLAAKEKAHLHYEVGDEVQAGSRSGIIPDHAAATIKDMINSAMAGVYDPAFEASRAGASFRASDAEITAALEPISEYIQSAGAGSSVLSEKTRNKLNSFIASARSSQSTNTRSGSSNSGTVMGASGQSIALDGRQSKSDPEILFQYIGRNAELTDKERANLETAQKMFTAGKDDETIRLATGWFRGKYDKRWRMETDDSQYTWKPKALTEEGVYTLGEAIKAKSLFSKYPQLKDMSFSYGLSTKDLKVGSIPVSGVFKPGWGGDKTININGNLSKDEALKTLVHEIQHAIQEIEGFAQGSHPDQFEQSLQDSQKYNEFHDAYLLSKMVDSAGDRYEAALLFEKRFKREPELIADSLLDRYSQEELFALKEKYKPKSRFDQYINTAGEIESRDVSARIGLSPEQRRAIAPYSSEQIAEQDAVVLFQTAYHGTPHKFDKFTTEKMGTGEGAQAYGWGLYFAGSKEVAEFYRGSLTKAKNAKIGKQTVAQLYAEIERQANKAKGDAAAQLYEKMAFLEDLEITWNYDESVERIDDPEVEEWAKGLRKQYKPAGYLYKAEIPDDNEYLDWDGPINQQPENIQNAVKGIENVNSWLAVMTDMTGAGVYEALQNNNSMTPKEASLKLKALGIPGIKYFDAGSRDSREGSLNYVIFDEADITNVEMLFQVEQPTQEQIDEAAQQIEAVRAKYENTPQWLQAPNGKPTKLTDRQWLQVRTPAFKAWFGDWENDPAKASKVVDENGEPLVVYHGTDVPLDRFDKNKIGSNFEGWSIGFHFTTMPAEANIYAGGPENKPGANIIPAFIVAKEPVMIKSNEAWSPSSLVDNDRFYLLQKVKDEKKDGIIATREKGDEYDGQNIVVFNPSQIKSATGNAGTFSQENPSILFQLAHEFLQSEEAQAEIKTAIDAIIKTTETAMAQSAETIARVRSEGKDGFARHLEGNQEIRRKMVANARAVGDHLLAGKPLFEKMTRYPGITDNDVLLDYAILHPSSREKGKYQISRFDRRGPFSHYGPGGLEEILREMLSDHYLPSDQETMDFSRQGRYIVEGKNEDLLFQISDDAVEEEARGFPSWKKWMEDVEKSYEFLGEQSSRPEGLEGEALAEWYRTTWEKANQQEDPNATEGDKDARFVAMMKADKKQDGFLRRLSEALYVSLQGATTEEAAELDRAKVLQSRIRVETPPRVQMAAQTVASGRELTPMARKYITTNIAKNARAYRALYAEITGDPGMAVQGNVFDDIKIEAPVAERWELMSFEERNRYARQVRDKDIARKIASGKIQLEGEIEGYIDSLEAQRRELNKDLAAQEAKLKEVESDLSFSDRQGARLVDQLDDAEETLKKAQKDLEDNRGRLDKKTAALQASMERVREVRAEYRDALLSARDEARLQTSQATRRAIRATKAEIKAKLDERRALEEYRERMIKMAKAIMTKPSDAIDYEFAQKIRAIQSGLDPHFRRAMPNWVRDIPRLELNDLWERFPDIMKTIMPKGAMDRLDKKPLNEWTETELEEVAEVVDNLRRDGREALRAKKFAQRQEAIRRQRAITGTIIEKLGDVQQYASGSEQDKKRQGRPVQKLADAYYGTIDIKRKAMILDGDRQGEAYDLLVSREREAYQKEQDNIDRRSAAVLQAMKDNDVKLDDLYATVKIERAGPNDTTATYTISDLLYVLKGSLEEQTAEAIATGVLANEDERRAAGEGPGPGRDALVAKGRARMNRVLAAAMGLPSKYKAVAEAITDDFAAEFPRINEVAIKEFNQEVSRVQNYVPMHRTEVTNDDLAAAVASDLLNTNGGAIQRGTEKGFTKSRIKISPEHQKPIKLDLFGTWKDALEMQEHFIAYAEYGRELNRVFKSNYSGQLQSRIRNGFGQKFLSTIHDQINEYQNPESFRRRSDTGKIIRALRGQLAPAYLGWRLSSVFKQIITSPLPFLQFVNPIEFAAAAMKMSTSPIQTWNEIAKKSATMRNRKMDMTMALLAEQQNKAATNKLERGYKRIQALGMKGLEWADRWSVGAGWLAVYQREIARTGDEEAAVKKADNAVSLSQPSGRSADLAPLFKDAKSAGGEALQAFVQFQQALNVIWQQWTYDMPTAIKNKETMRVLGFLAGTILAGVALGAASGDSDDEDKGAIFSAFSQFTDSVPLIGEYASAVARTIITGEKQRMFADDLFPALTKGYNAIQAVTDQEWQTALDNMLQSIGYAIGAPVGGVREINRVIEGDPLALIGRKKE